MHITQNNHPKNTRALSRNALIARQRAGLGGLGKFKFRSIVRAITAPARALVVSPIKKIAGTRIAKTVEKKVFRPVMKPVKKVATVALPVMSFIPGVGTAAAAITSLLLAADKLRAQKAAERAARRDTAAIDAQIAATEAKIAELEKRPPEASGAFTANSAIGADTAASNGETVPDIVPGTTPVKKPVPWGLLAAGAAATVALLKG